MNFEYLSGELLVDSMVTVDEVSSAGVSVASHQGTFHVAWAGRDHRINLMWSPDARQFTGKHTLDYRSSVVNEGVRAVAPSLASGSGGLLLVWPSDHAAPPRRFPTLMRFGDRAAGLTVFGQAVRRPPYSAISVTEWGGEVVAAWAIFGAFSSKAMMARSHGRAFADPIELGRGIAPVSLCTVGGELVVAWGGKGLRANVNILWSRGGQLGKPFNIRGVATASVCALDNELVVCWQQERSHFLGFFRNGGLVPALRVPVPPSGFRKPVSAVGLCQHGQDLVLGWQGQHRGIHVARLRRAAAGNHASSGM